MIQYWIDKKVKENGVFKIEGWAIPNTPSNTLQAIVMTSSHEVAEAEVTYIDRSDVALSILGTAVDVKFGFSIIINADEYPEVTVNIYSMEDETDYISIELSDAVLINEKRLAIPRKIVRTTKGFIRADKKRAYIKEVLSNPQSAIDSKYRRWYRKQQPSLHELRAQSNEVFPYMPLISLVVPVYNPRPEHLKALVRSVSNQSYQNWQLCLANGKGDNLEIAKLIRTMTNSDSRIVTARLKENRGISGNTNVGLQMAEGEWVAFADQDDYIAPNAFYEYVKAINKDPSIDALYCDEDKLDDETGHHFMPHFKSDFNLDLLLCNNYICHMFMVRQSVIDEVGPLRKEFDGAQDHDFILRCSRVCKHIAHVPKMLYSWRSHAQSTSMDADSKTYAFDAGVAAVNDYYASRGIQARASRLKTPGFYRTDFSVSNEPLVSILIPNKDHYEDLEKCIRSILLMSTYNNYEIIIIENNSEEEETFIGYKRLEREDSRIRTIVWKDTFNYAAINNYGAKEAKGDYLLLLNNDTEQISPDLLTSMVGYLQRPEVGIVGAKLLYADKTVQHAGVLIGVDHSAFHQFLGYADGDPGYMGRARISQNMSGVTGACMMVKRELWDKVKGMDEKFVVAYNDVDFCLKAEKAGYLCVYDAFVKMYHYESKTRGSDMTEENTKRLDLERDHLISKWGDRMEYDPYYNINLCLEKGFYVLK